MYRFIGRHAPEVLALFFFTIFLIGGVFCAWYVDRAWLNRAGALIIIVGVLLAASRFHEWVQAKAGRFIEENFETIAKNILAEVESKVGPLLTDERRNTIAATLKTRVHTELEEFIGREKRRIKNLEIALIVIGTFLNGLGDYLIGLLKHGT